MYIHRLATKTGILSLGAGALAYFHSRKFLPRTLLAEADDIDTKPAKSSVSSQNPPLRHLQLQQVQVMFRHGARTPLHLMPKLPEVAYEPAFIMREHQASLFPYERALYGSGKPVDWSNYEKELKKTQYRAGVPRGALTALGKDQTYQLGLRIKDSYRDSLNLSAYNPKDVLTLSSNIERTVESARCVLAGFFGRDHLRAYAQNHSPVTIFIPDPKYNFLVPNTYSCAVLNKVNHAGMLHSDSIPGFKSERLIIEQQLNEEREMSLQAVRSIQAQINKKCGSASLIHCCRDPVVENPDLQPLIEERSRAIKAVSRLWGYALTKHPSLKEVITKTEAQVLSYLTQLRVEPLQERFTEGYRIHLFFQSNPFFYNDHLFKEIRINKLTGTITSQSQPIVWKETGKSLEKEVKSGADKSCQCQKDKSSQNQPTKLCECKSSKARSFLQWYVSPVLDHNDPIGKAVIEDVWCNPLDYLELKGKHSDDWDRPFNFVFERDDLMARLAHGLPYPDQLLPFQQLINKNATTMLYYAMAGQHAAERLVVARLSAGPLLTFAVDESEKVLKKNTTAHKLCLYSTHDSTLTALMELLGLWEGEWPPFAADLRLELYQGTDSQEYFVRVLYCGQVRTICGLTQELMPWEDFLKAIDSKLIRETEYREVCDSDVLVRLAQDVLRHEAGEPVLPSEAPAGM